MMGLWVDVIYFANCSLKLSLLLKKKIKGLTLVCLYNNKKIKKILVKEILRAAQNGARHEEKK